MITGKTTTTTTTTDGFPLGTPRQRHGQQQRHGRWESSFSSSSALTTGGEAWNTVNQPTTPSAVAAVGGSRPRTRPASGPGPTRWPGNSQRSPSSCRRSRAPRSSGFVGVRDRVRPLMIARYEPTPASFDGATSLLSWTREKAPGSIAGQILCGCKSSAFFSTGFCAAAPDCHARPNFCTFLRVFA